MSRANARDEWRAAAAASDGNLGAAATALGVAAARLNHAAADGGALPVSDCEYCLDDPERGDYCDAEQGAVAVDGYVCTRPEGHDGPHVACAPRNWIHQLAEWGSEEVSEA